MGQQSNSPNHFPFIAPEVLADGLVHVHCMPLDLLPPIGSNSTEGNAFWIRRKLRPEGQGGNFHNMPVLGLGIYYVGDQAILLVPSKEHLNQVVQQYNSGGFMFVDTAGFDDPDEFLTKLSSRRFPFSKNREATISGVEDTWLEFMLGSDPSYPDGIAISPHEHDLVDHGAIVASPESEVNKIAAVAQIAISLSQVTKNSIVGLLDRTLDLLSDYAILPAQSSSAAEARYKKYVWEKMQICVDSVNIQIGEALYGGRMPWLMSEQMAQKAIENGVGLVLNQAAFDETISLMQGLGRDNPSPTQKPLGALAVAA